MTYLFVFMGLVLVASIAAAAISGHYRRYDRVPQVGQQSLGTTATMGQMLRRGPVGLIATPEEATRQQVAASQVYDASDDLLDPRSPHHAQWLAAHAEDDPPASE